MITAPVSPQTSQCTPQTTGAPAPAILNDFNTFVTMLTVQIKNQDPLNPMESSEFAVQLATFAGVEQQVRTNDLLREIATVKSGLGEAGSLIGQNVRVMGDLLHTGAGIQLSLPGNSVADDARLAISKPDGTVVARFDVPSQKTEFAWDGRDEHEIPLVNGTYQAQVAYLLGEQTVSQVAATSVMNVREVSVNEGQVAYLLSNGQSVSSEQIVGLLGRSENQ